MYLWQTMRAILTFWGQPIMFSSRPNSDLRSTQWMMRDQRNLQFTRPIKLEYESLVHILIEPRLRCNDAREEVQAIGRHRVQDKQRVFNVHRTIALNDHFVRIKIRRLICCRDSPVFHTFCLSSPNSAVLQATLWAQFSYWFGDLGSIDGWRRRAKW